MRKQHPDPGDWGYCRNCHKSTFHTFVFAGELEDDEFGESKDGKVRVCSGQCFDCGNVRSWLTGESILVKYPLKVVPYDQIPEWRNEKTLRRIDRIAEALEENFEKEARFRIGNK
jgi:hypothetical protein